LRPLVLAGEVASWPLRSDTALFGSLHCTNRVVPVPFAIATREVRPAIFEPRLFEARSRWPVRPRWRRPHSPIHKDFMLSPVETVNVGNVLEVIGDPPHAREAAAEALAIRRQLGERSAALTLSCLAKSGRGRAFGLGGDEHQEAVASCDRSASAADSP
jgi:hypothetical protein